MSGGLRACLIALGLLTTDLADLESIPSPRKANDALP